MTTVLLLFDSRGGLTEQLAEAIAEGVRSVDGAVLSYRRLDDASPDELKDWVDHTGDLWETGDLVGKVGAAFTAGWSRSAGMETTLLQLLHLLFAHGMLIVGLPWSERMRVAGSYYGATAHGEVTDEDRAQARALGRRVAETTLALLPSG